MKLTIKTLSLALRKSDVSIELSGLRYFYGTIGSGKSSIGRLVDYCFGGDIELTPALQQEFVSAKLDVEINGIDLQLTRDRQADSLIASWKESGDSAYQVALPARVADGEIIPDTGVEVLSDLIFHIAKENPPRVRRRKGRPDELLERLSFRDLFRFCYLEQRWMDSDFFRLTSDNYAVKQKSVDTLRFVLAYATERVAELEAKLQIVREERVAAEGAAAGLASALKEAGFEDILTLEEKMAQLQVKIDEAKLESQAARGERKNIPHAVDELRNSARSLALDLDALEQAATDVEGRKTTLLRQANELRMLTVRYERTASARAILGGVDFTSCPRCSQALPQRLGHECAVCGQEEPTQESRGEIANRAISEDISSRQRELADAIGLLESQKRSLNRRMRVQREAKIQADQALSTRMREYDSAFLSQALQKERQLAMLQQELLSLKKYRKLPEVVSELTEKVHALAAREISLRGELEESRKQAFLDRRKIKRLSDLFIDCLVRSKFPDVKSTDEAEIDPASFYPRITLGKKHGLVDLTFENAGSGGMMALFKTCFAIALHRLSAESSYDRLPSVLIIDTPTKNVSSKENPEVIDAFFGMVYQLAEFELSGMQIIIIENEFTAPISKTVPLNVRHMVRGTTDHPPLVPYLSGDFE